MAKIIKLDDLKSNILEKKVFSSWRKRFGNSFTSETRITDISNKTLLYLSQPGEDSAMAFYELIMGVLDLGPASKFSSLEKKNQLHVMETHLFLSDLFRFEMMHRLDWIDPTSCSIISLIDLVRSFEKCRDDFRENPPKLSQTHPDYNSYINLHERDREGFIRRLLPGALDIFQRKLIQ